MGYRFYEKVPRLFYKRVFQKKAAAFFYKRLFYEILAVFDKRLLTTFRSRLLLIIKTTHSNYGNALS